MKAWIEAQVRITSVGFASRYKAAMMAVFTDQEGTRTDARKIINITANKSLLSVDVEVGQIWKVRGHSSTSQVHKNKYKLDEIRISASEMEIILPSNGEAFVQFVGAQKNFRGIGEVKARQLWNRWGEELIPKIKSGCKEDFRSILSEDSITALFEGFAKYTALEHLGFFTKHGIPQNVLQRIFKKHRSDIKQRIEQDPYRLLSFGLRWQTVDAIAQNKLGISRDAPVRLSAAIEASLLEESQKRGDTVLPHTVVRTALRTRLEDDHLVTRALHQRNESGAFVVSFFGYHPTGMLIMESVIAKRLTSFTRKPMCFEILETSAFKTEVNALGFQPTDKQRMAVANSYNNHVSVITGGAGTGKTTVLRLVAQTLKSMGISIHSVALSGRAAKRMSEATGMKSLTIAKFLRSQALQGDGKLLIVDEASMLDTQTMYRIVTHTTPEVRILLVGDVDQLSPIGAGHVLRDVVNSTMIPTTELDVVKRQKGDSGIPGYSQAIRTGVVPSKLTTEHVFFHEVEPEKIDATCISLVSENPKSTMILGATYKSVYGGINKLNSLAQTALNPGAKRWEFYVDGEYKHLDIYDGDPVIFTANDYNADIQNGTLGRMTSVNQEPGSFGEIETHEKKVISVTRSLLESLRAAWAISLHKAQGSQFKRVVIPLSSSRLIDRNWLYTAVTRAELEVHIVGSVDVFRKAILRESSSGKRQTHLTALLKSAGKLTSLEKRDEAAP